MARQHDKQHATTVILTEAVPACRFVSYSGKAASQAARTYDIDDCCGVTEYGGSAGQAVSAITGYSALVEAGEAITAGVLVTSGTGGVAMVGSNLDHVGRALADAAAAGRFLEVQLLDPEHPISSGG